MSQLADALRELNVFNEHNLVSRFGGPRDVYVIYTPYEPRIGGAYAQVISPHFKTEPTGGYWAHYGHKTFIGNKAESMPKAIEWATEHYGIAEWAPSPFRGAKVPKHVLDAAKRAVKEPKS